VFNDLCFFDDGFCRRLSVGRGIEAVGLCHLSRLPKDQSEDRCGGPELNAFGSCTVENIQFLGFPEGNEGRSAPICGLKKVPAVHYAFETRKISG